MNFWVKPTTRTPKALLRQSRIPNDLAPEGSGCYPICNVWYFNSWEVGIFFDVFGIKVSLLPY